MKKYIALALVLVMVLTLSACGLSKDELCHRWTMMDNFDEDEARETLAAYGFYDEEIALADLNSIGAVRYLTFTKDGNYSYSYDEAASTAKMVTYYDNLLTTIYNNLDSLVEIYGEGVKDEYTEEEFKDLYAYIYDFETYDDLLNAMAEDTFDFSDAGEKGTYKISGSKVTMYVNGTGDGEYVNCTIENNTLTVRYTNATEIYTLAD